jgi:phage tail-like protein
MPVTGDRNDPLLAFRFEVTLDAIPVGGFSECQGLQLETKVEEYAEGGLNSHVHKLPTRTSQSNIVLKRGVADDKMWLWYYALTLGQVQRLNGTIVLHDPNGDQPPLIWHFIQAFPCKWVGPDLNAGQSSVAVETVELCHQGLLRLPWLP